MMCFWCHTNPCFPQCQQFILLYIFFDYLPMHMCNCISWNLHASIVEILSVHFSQPIPSIIALFFFVYAELTFHLSLFFLSTSSPSFFIITIFVHHHHRCSSSPSLFIISNFFSIFFLPSSLFDVDFLRRWHSSTSAFFKK